MHKNGKIWAESEGEGQGCTFFVHVPLHSHHHVDASLLTRSGSVDVRIAANRSEIAVDPRTTSSISRGSLAIVVNQSLVNEPEGKHSESMPPPQDPVVEAWKPTILVVDDSAMNRKMLVRMLITKGFACCEAEDGMAALCEVSRMNFRKSIAGSKFGDVSPVPPSAGGGTLVGSSPQIVARKRNTILAAKARYGQSIAESLEFGSQQNFVIDAVLIDSNMPRMNGPEAVIEMRKIGFLGPIIGVSGGDEKSLKEFLDAGADDTMQKPAQSDHLVNMLLTGLELAVLKETSRQTLSGGYDGDLSAASEKARQDYIARLRRFLDVCKRVVIT